MKQQLFETTVTVDLTELLPKVGQLLDGNKVELKLIEYYKYLHNENDSPLKLFNKYISSFYYKDEIVRPESDVYFYIKDKMYINKVMNFLDSIYLILIDHVNPEFVDIVFSKFITNDDNKLIVEFKVYYPERIRKWVEEK